jgi:O-antigen/teichoic acid export membrane protein
MGIVFRQSVKTSIVVFSGAVLGALTLWLSTKYVPKQEYGFIKTLTAWALMLSNFAPFGLNTTLAVFIHRYNGQDAKRKMLLTICMVVPLALTLVISLLYLLFPEWILHHFQPGDAPLMRRFYLWLPIYVLMFVYMTILDQYLCSQMKVAISAFMREVLLRVLNIGLIALFACNLISFPVLVIATVLVYLIPVSAYFVLSFKTNGFGLTTETSCFTREEYREIIHFSWYHYILYISIMLMVYMDQRLIPFYDHSGFSTVAVYSVAVYFISLVNLPFKAFIQASFSAFASAFAENKMDAAKDIFVRSSINILIATAGLAIIVVCNLDNAVAIIGTGKNYSGLIPAFLVLLIGQLVNTATGMNDQVLSITNYYKFNFYVSVCISILLFILIRFLVPIYGILGAAWASTTTLIIYNTIKFFFVWKKVDMQPFSVNTLLIIIAALPALAAGYFFPYLFDANRHIYVHTFIDAAMRSTIVLVVYALMLIWLKPSPDLQVYLAQVKKNKRLF